MFAWMQSKWSKAKERLGAWRKKPAPAPDLSEQEYAFDVYRPAERLVYTYWHGTGYRMADPLVLYRKMMAVGPELSVDIKVANTPGYKGAAEGHAKMIEKIKNIFEVKSFDEGGLTEVEMMELFDHFNDFCGDVEKKTSPPPTSPTGTSGTTPPSSAESPPTSSSSASGSTDAAPPTESPPPSPPAPESPSA